MLRITKVLYICAQVTKLNKHKMKKIILSAVALVAFGFAAQAQETTTSGEGGFAQGDMFISGSVGFSNQKQGDDKTNTFEIAPRFAYFATSNIAVGAKVGYSTYKNEVAAGTTADRNAFTVGVFGRYYGTPASKFSLFGELGVDYSTVNNKAIAPATEDVKTNGFGVGFRPGISYFVSSNFAIEATFGALSYNSTKVDVDGAEAENTFNLNLNLTNIGFGLVYKF